MGRPKNAQWIDAEEVAQAYWSGHGSHAQRLAAAVKRGIICIVRVSTNFQARTSLGSIRRQEDESVGNLVRMGIPRERIEVVSMLGESGSADQSRPKFWRIVRRAQMGGIGIVAVARDDRLSRNTLDAEHLFDALEAHGGFMAVDGMLLDPANQTQRLMLKIGSALAEHENTHRLERNARDRLTLASDGGVCVGLTTGLTWGNPSDRAFRAAMEEAGLGEWLQEERLRAYKAHAQRDGRVLYPLPCPDRDLFRAVHLCFDWLMECGNLRGVVERIRSDPQWPHPGRYPVRPSHLWQPERPTAWQPIVDKHGSHATFHSHLWTWFQSAELYGIYEYRALVRRSKVKDVRSLYRRIWIENAFPSFRPTEDLARVREILAGKQGRLGGYHGPRNHFTPRMRCAQILADGTVCGRSISAAYRVGSPVTTSTNCGPRHPSPSVPLLAIDQVVVRIVRQAYSRPRLARLLSRVQRDEKDRTETLIQLRKALNEVERRAAVALQLRLASMDATEQGDLEAARATLKEKARGLQREIHQAEMHEDEIGTLEAMEVERILTIGQDLAELLPRAERIEGKVREILRELIVCVHVRPLTRYLAVLEVEFRGGGRIRRIAPMRSSEATHAVRAWAHTRLSSLWSEWVATGAPGSDARVRKEAERAARQLDRILTPKGKKAEWSGDRVLGAALLHEYGDKLPPRLGAQTPLATLVGRAHAARREVWQKALRGRLGPLSVHEGRIAVAPTREELHHAFPELARRDVAKSARWPLADTAWVHALSEEIGMGPVTIRNIAGVRSGAHQDDAGRWYVRRSDSPAERPRSLASALENAPEKFRSLDPAYWVPMHEARRRYPAFSEYRLLRYAPNFVTKCGGLRLNGRMLWLGPEIVRSLTPTPLADAVAAVGYEGRADEFLRRDPFLRELQGRVGKYLRNSLTQAVARGHVVEVTADAPGRGGPLGSFVLVPPHIRTTTDLSVALAWLRGESDAPAAGTRKQASAVNRKRRNAPAGEQAQRSVSLPSADADGESNAEQSRAVGTGSSRLPQPAHHVQTEATTMTQTTTQIPANEVTVAQSGALSGSTAPAPCVLVYMRSAVAGPADIVEPQRHAIEEYLRAAGLIPAEATIPGEHSPARGVFVDLGGSGTTDLRSRPAGSALMHVCECSGNDVGQETQARSKVLVIDSWDRLTRTDDLPRLQAELAAHGWSVHSVREGEDIAEHAVLDQLRDLLPRFEKEQEARLMAHRAL